MNKRKKRIFKTSMLVVCFLFVFLMLNPMNAEAAKRKKGWYTEGKATYYYKKNQRLIGMQTIKEDTYYFRPKDGRMLKRKWKFVNYGYYYFGADGKMAKSRWIGNYYVDEHGRMATNQWIGRYFVGEDGKWIPNFKAGWHQIGNNWYYYTKKGVKKVNTWVKYKGQRYFVDANGVMLTRMQIISDRSYYFTGKGILKKNCWVKSGGWYYYANERGVLNTKDRMNAKKRSRATVIEYNAPTLKVRIEKKRQYSTDYWVAKVKISNIGQMQGGLSNGTYGGSLQRVSSALNVRNGIIGINGSRFDGYGRPGNDAVMIKDGRVYENATLGTSKCLMAVDWNGYMFTAEPGLSGITLQQKWDIKDTYSFGPILLENGETVPYSEQGDPFSLMYYDDPRAAVGMVRPGEYVLLVADGRSSGSRGLEGHEMVSIFKRYGCTYAYNLDGGGSATLAYRGEVLNHPSDGTERPVGDFMIFTE